ncbi:hypothetical protein ACGF0J_21910 [Nonomuraea sp. NPDC047897]|uniref:hypothetical protein n=1 Tax=Nonomuraea sp. NPDC047897 TaxID=3364346 RepID=UPI003723DFEC
MSAPQFGSPEWQQQFQEGIERASRQLGEALNQVPRTLAAQGAVGWAYSGDLDQLRAGLASMKPEQLRELSTAAAALASLADVELASRT